MIEDQFLSNNKDEKKYKIIIVGDCDVGKTSLFWRFTEGDYFAQKDPRITIIDFKKKEITLDQKPITLYIWDTAGQEKHRSIVATYFKGCHGILMVFDLSKESSFQNIKNQWYAICKNKADRAQIVLVGNKSDQDKKVTQSQMAQWCKSNNIKYLQSSAKLNINVDESFMTLARLINQNESKEFSKSPSFILRSKTPKQTKTKSCC